MNIQELSDWLKSKEFKGLAEEEKAQLTAKYLDTIVGIRDELEYQATICSSEIVRMTLKHVLDDIVDRRLNDASREREWYER